MLKKKGRLKEAEVREREKTEEYCLSFMPILLRLCSATPLISGFKARRRSRVWKREREEERERGRERRERRRRREGKDEEEEEEEDAMLRRRSGVMQKENFKAQKTGSNLSSESSFSSNSLEKMKNSHHFFNVPGLFVGKVLQDSDSVKSPTSPLDHRIFSNLGCSFVKSPGKSWDCSRVGLGLVDSLGDESKNILLGSQMRTISIPTPKTSNLSSISMEKIGDSCPNDKAKQIYSNPKPNYDVFVSDSKSSNSGSSPTTTRSQFDSSLLSASLPVSINSIHGFMDSLSASEIELSEDYTCIISHGPNPKKIHIFGDRVLENYVVDSPDSKKEEEEEGGGSHWIVKSLENSPPFPSKDFLSFCCFCKKKLEAGKDIYMYRGEKAFCSCNCREQEMLLEEETETEMGTGNPATCSCDSPTSSSFHEDLFH